LSRRVIALGAGTGFFTAYLGAITRRLKFYNTPFHAIGFTLGGAILGYYADGWAVYVREQIDIKVEKSLRLRKERLVKEEEKNKKYQQ